MKNKPSSFSLEAQFSQKVTRREAIQGMAKMAGGVMIASSGLSVLISGCGSEATTSGATVESGFQSCGNTSLLVFEDKVSTHTHDIDLTLAQISAGSDTTFLLLADQMPVCTSGQSGYQDTLHQHTVTITAADLASLAAGQKITINHDNDGDDDPHPHQVVLQLKS